MFVVSCTLIGLFLFLIGTSGNGLCIIVFLRQKFRHRIITPYFVVLLFADSIYLLFRLIKLFYYSQTLFNLNFDSKESCSNTFLVRAYQRATQTWPQTLVPLVHFEIYMRFAIILMCIVSAQRTTLLTRSLKRLILPAAYKDTQKYKWTFLFIILSFGLAYGFEFVGLTLFCSESANRDLSYQWFVYMSKYMENSSYLLTSRMTNQPDVLKCVNDSMINLQNENQSSISSDLICTKEELIDILSHYFDQHQRTIVNLIQKIFYHQTNHRLTRNEIRRKFHFHECLFPQNPTFFHRYYDFMYGRTFGFNRYTFILVFGSVLPSLITIISNILSVYRVRQLNRVTSKHILPCRRRTDDTRRVLLVITVECLFAIVKSWFSDILISVIYCKGTLLADDDCPRYLQTNYQLLVMFDMLNSISNIILHCLCGKHFRRELGRIFQSCYRCLERIFADLCCCYLQFHCQNINQEPYISYNASISENDSSNNHLYLNIRRSSNFTPKHCCACRWYFNRRPLIASQQCLSRISKACLRKNSNPFSVHYHSVTQRTQALPLSTTHSMRLYFPKQTK